jgi:hypothetical protein
VVKRKQVFNSFKQVCLVFISDGLDNNMPQCMLDLDGLPEMPAPCRIVSVGCQGFPTTLASGKLFQLFGGRNNLCDSPVIQCDYPSEVGDVFKTLYDIIEKPDPSPPPTLDDLRHCLTVSDLARLAKRAYNACVLQCMYRKTKSELDAFSECKEILGAVRVGLARCVRDMKASRPRSECVVMLSEELAPSASSATLREALAATTAVDALQGRVRQCIDMASRQELVADRDDEFKLEVAGFAARFKRLSAKGLRYHALDAGKVKDSLVRFLASYPESPEDAKADALLVDADSGASLFDMFRDAKTVLHAVRDDNFTVADIVEKLPQLVIPVLVADLSQGAAMNCWLVQCLAVGRSCVTVQDILLGLDDCDAEPDLARANCGQRPDRAQADEMMAEAAALMDLDPAEVLRLEAPCPVNARVPLQPGRPVSASAPLPLQPRSNCAVLLASEALGGNATFVKFTASSLLYRNQAVFHGEALWSLMAAAVTRLLQEVPSDPSAVRVLDLVRASFRLAYRDHQRFRAYCERMACDSAFRECLATEHPQLDRSLACPHLTKPVFAMWIMASEGRPWTAQALGLRYRGFLVEMFHRAKVGLVWAEADYLRPVADVVEGRLREVLPATSAGIVGLAPTHLQAAEKVKAAVWESLKPTSVLPDTIMSKPEIDMAKVRGASHLQFDYRAAQAIFRGLAVLSGVGEEFSAEQTPLDLARQLELAAVQDNLKRCREGDCATPMTKVLASLLPCSYHEDLLFVLFFLIVRLQSVFQHLGYMHGFRIWYRQAVLVAAGKLTGMYLDALRECHQLQLAVRLDEEHVRAWSSQYGVDAVAALDLDDKGLSRTACLCQGCPHFLRPLGPSNRPGKVSPVLKAHLASIPHVPGLHKAVFGLYPQLPGEPEGAYVDRVAALVRAGEHLEERHPDAEAIVARIRQLDAMFSQDKASALADHLIKYKEYGVQQIRSDFGQPGQLEEAVRRVMRSPVLGRDETFRALSAAFQVDE